MASKIGWTFAGVIAVVCGIWWFNNQSSLATLNDGVYDCKVVYVNLSNKYEILVDGDQQPFAGKARVQAGEVVSYSVPNDILGWSDQPNLSVKNVGRHHFRLMDGANHWNRLAMACDESSN